MLAKLRLDVVRERKEGDYLARPIEIALGCMTGVLVANVYYIHPIISEVAVDFGISPASIGLVPVLNQIALALGILFLLPLGDRYSNKHLLILFATGQTACLLVMIFSTGFLAFLIGSTALGLCTIGPYLLPAYVSKRVSPTRLGAMTATLSVGNGIGILIARIVSGQIAETFDWRLVYVAAAGAMVIITCLMPFILEDRSKDDRSGDEGSYLAFAFSVFSLIKRSPRVIRSSIIQSLNFGVYVSVWMALALHLTSPEMGYGVDVVGYLALVALFGMFTTPRFGQWADRIGAEQARFLLTIAQLGGTLILLVTGSSLWLLLIPVIALNVIGPALDVSGRMTTLSAPPDVRNRLMAGFFFTGFVGGGLASWAATASYSFAGWAGSSAFTLSLACISICLAWSEARRAKASH